MPTGLEMISGQTSPPNLLTEADLISLMDKHGIGTITLSLTTCNIFNIYVFSA